jgi:hypothetical protein
VVAEQPLYTSSKASRHGRQHCRRPYSSAKISRKQDGEMRAVQRRRHRDLP